MFYLKLTMTMQTDQPKKFKEGDFAANPLFAMMPTGKIDFKTGQPEMSIMIQQGMTFRDRCAIEAINVFKAEFNTADALQKDFSLVTDACYRLADSMLKSRGL